MDLYFFQRKQWWWLLCCWCKENGSFSLEQESSSWFLSHLYGLVDLFGWTWALIIIYVIYIVMDVICADGCVDGWYICDGWDIYVMDEIYMWWMRYICDICLYEFICHDEIYKKNYCFGSLSRVLHSAKDPVAECHGHNTRQSWKMGVRKTIFLALPSAMTMALGKEFKKKFKLCQVPAIGHSTKEFKKKFKLCRVPEIGHSAKNFF